MVAFVNRVELIGFMGGPVELRTTGGGKTVGTLSIGTTSYRKIDGKPVEKTTWHRVVIFGANAEFAAKYLDKGAYVRVEGSLETRSYDDDNGVRRYITEIAGRLESLDRRRSAQDQAEQSAPEPEPEPEPMPDYDQFDHDIPQ